jgi:hypothetical protein
LTEDQRKQIVSALLAGVQWIEKKAIGEGKSPRQIPRFQRGLFKKLADQYGVHPRTISRIWKVAFANRNNPEIGVFRATPKKKTGRPHRYDTNDIKMKVAALPLCKKLSIRRLGAALEMPTSTLHDYITRGKEEGKPIIRGHSSAIKPALKDHHISSRLEFAISRLDLTTGRFDDCYQEVHVDEKWFNLTREKLHCWLSVDEPDPERITRHKSHIPKVCPWRLF